MIVLLAIFGIILVGVGILALITTLVGIIAPTLVSLVVIWVIYRVVRKGLKTIKDKTE